MYNQANLWLNTITGNAKSGSALKRSHKPSTVGLNTYCQYVQRESKRQIYHYKEIVRIISSNPPWKKMAIPDYLV